MYLSIYYIFMTTQEIATKLVELCRAGDYHTCYAELFSEDVVTVGPKWSPEEEPTLGMAALKAKWAKWHDMMEEFLGWWTSDPVVAEDCFSVAMWFTCIYKGQTEKSEESEIVVYEVKDSKIVKETYFYAVK